VPTLIKKLKNSLQYSLSNNRGHGNRLKKSVEFFETDGEAGVSMNYSSRQCAGVKSCQYLSDELKTLHVEVDMSEGHLWAKLLAEQEKPENTTWTQQVETLYEMYQDYPCERPSLTNRNGCQGRTVIRSLKSKASNTIYT
jgi:hypothetical protein